LVGGIIFILFGAYKIILNYVKALSAKSNKMLNSSKHLVVSGILLNIFNPSVWVFWAATVSAVGTLTQHSRNLNLLFFIFCFATFIGIDLLKMYYASKLKKFITPKILKILNLIIGIGFCVVGFSLIFQYFRV
jgi:threonine/homoserine/homoserine lactone efflux protein